jgi:hypothetical protein
MGEVVSIEDPSNYEVVSRRLRRLLAQGDYEIRGHARQRMRERDYLVGDIVNLLRLGIIVSHSFVNGAWRRKVRGRTVEGKKARCIVEIDGLLIVVTVI